MGKSFWCTIFATLVAFAVCDSVAAGQQTPTVLGQVVASTAATENGNPLPSGGTIFDGDVVATGPDGHALIKLLSSTQVSLNENTSVHFAKISERAVMELRNGTVVVENSGKVFALIQTPKFQVQPVSPENSKIYEGIMADNSTYIEAGQGDALIQDLKSGQSYVLPTGQNVMIPLDAVGVPGLQPQEATQQTQAPSNPAPPTSKIKPGKSSGHNTPLIVGIAAAAGVGGIVAALAGGGGGGQPASPSAP